MLLRKPKPYIARKFKMDTDTRDTFFVGKFVCKNGKSEWWVKYDDMPRPHTDKYSLATYFEEWCFVEKIPLPENPAVCANLAELELVQQLSADDRCDAATVLESLSSEFSSQVVSLSSMF